jgi:hypothetical protein
LLAASTAHIGCIIPAAGLDKIVADFLGRVFRFAASMQAGRIRESFRNIRPSKRKHLNMANEFNPAASAARDSLRRHFPEMDAATRGKTLRILTEQGHLVDDVKDAIYAKAARTPISPLQASAAQPHKFAEVVGACRHLGFHISASDSKPIDVVAMDEAFRGKDINARARIKTALYALGLIPA